MPWLINPYQLKTDENIPLMALHIARDRDRDRNREMMGLYITLCTVHTTQGKGQIHGTIVFYCAHPVPYPCPWPGPLQCVWAITERDETRWWQKGWWLHSGKLPFIFMDCACTDFFYLSLSALEKIFLPVMSGFWDCAECLLFIKLSNALHSQLQQPTVLTLLQPLLRTKICM